MAVKTEVYEQEKHLLVQYGSAASEAIFDYPCQFFKLQNRVGYVAYRIEHSCAVVFGGPICPQDEASEFLEAFHQFCDSRSLNIIYVTVTEPALSAIKPYCHILLEACEELVFNPQVNVLDKSHRLKHRVEKAQKHGLTVHEYFPTDETIESQILEVGKKWREGIKGPNVFLGHLNFFESYIGNRWFFVRDGQEITSMLMLSKLEAFNGWLLKFLVTKPGAFHETSEMLMTTVLEILRNEGYIFLSKGMEPANNLKVIKGLGKFSIFMFQKNF